MKFQIPYKAGQERIVRHFLIWPRTIKGITRWLERASYKQTSIQKFYKWIEDGVYWKEITEAAYRVIENNNKVITDQKPIYSTLYWENIEWTDLVDWSDLSSDSIISKLSKPE